MSGLDHHEVRRIAALAKLDIPEAELDLFVRQLAEIVDYVGQLSRLETEAIPPTSHLHEQSSPLRADAVRPSLDRGRVIEQAPDGQPELGFFRVPKVIGG